MGVLDTVTGFLGLKKANGEWNTRNIAIIAGGLLLGGTGVLSFLGPAFGSGAGAIFAGGVAGVLAAKAADHFLPSSSTSNEQAAPDTGGMRPHAPDGTGPVISPGPIPGRTGSGPAGPGH